MFNQVFICETPHKRYLNELIEVDVKPQPNPQIELVTTKTKLEVEDVKVEIDKQVFEGTELEAKHEHKFNQNMNKCFTLISAEEIKVQKQSFSVEQDKEVVTNHLCTKQSNSDPQEKNVNINVNNCQTVQLPHDFLQDPIKIQDENKIANIHEKQLDTRNIIITANESGYIIPDQPPTESSIKVLQKEDYSTLNKNHCHGTTSSIASPSRDSIDGDDSCSDWEQEYFFSSVKSKLHSKTKELENRNVTFLNTSYQSINSTTLKNKTKENSIVSDPVKVQIQSTMNNLGLEILNIDLSNKVIYVSKNSIKRIENVTPREPTINSKITKKVKNKTIKVSEQNKKVKQGLKNKTTLKVTKSKVIAKDVEGNEEVYMCNICNNFFKSKKQLHAHAKYSLCNGFRREKKHQCDVCGKLFNGFEKLQDHKNSHFQARPYKCFDCEKCFNSKSTRQMHHRTMHKNIRVSYLCCYCGITTSNIKHLLAHEETHRLPEGAEIPTPFKCLQCGKGFISQFKLTGHLKEHKSKKCPTCSEEFLSDAPLRMHLENVHGIVKIFSCDICTKTFKTPENLRLHVKSHSTIMSFFCDICDKGFKQKHHIEQHMITHSDERPISCSLCDETFKRKTHLKQHIKSAHESRNKGKKTAKKASRESSD
uniref:C2H2-type domain-containing protein n=1 Tax=Homalodisca liturata TaxID=320908 RepID=A0A1B6J4Z5_9HEMI